MHRHFGEDGVVWLFGSRADDSKKGGGYDFPIETSLDQPDAIVEHKIALIAALQSSPPFEDEKIDLIVKQWNPGFGMLVYGVAKEEGNAVVGSKRFMHIYLRRQPTAVSAARHNET